MAWIVLRDVPKQRVSLDLLEYPIGGGFRGFQGVLPGFHYVRIYEEETPVAGAELFIGSFQSAIALKWSEGELAPDESEEAEELCALAANGAMDSALAHPMAGGHAKTSLDWRAATSLIDRPLDAIPLSTNGSDAPGQARYEQFRARYGDGDGALRALQADWLRTLLFEDEAAAMRYARALRAHYDAGERRIEDDREYFVRFADTLRAMLSLAPALTEIESINEGVDRLIEDLRDVAEAVKDKALATAAEDLAAAMGGEGVTED